jgi:hypothetical protein
MLERILTVVIVAGVGYWYWSGPYQEKKNPTYGQRLKQYNQAMADCVENRTYAASRGAVSAAYAQAKCAEELNFYFEDGQWYSYDDVRRD